MPDPSTPQAGGSTLGGGLPNGANTPNTGAYGSQSGGYGTLQKGYHGGPHLEVRNPFGDHPYDIEVPSISLPEGTQHGAGYLGQSIYDTGPSPAFSGYSLYDLASQAAPFGSQNSMYGPAFGMLLPQDYSTAPSAPAGNQGAQAPGQPPGLSDLYGYLAMTGGLDPYTYSALAGGLGGGYAPPTVSSPYR